MRGWKNNDCINTVVQDEERMAKLEDDLKHVRTKAEEADKQYDEVSKKLQVGGWQLDDVKSFRLGAVYTDSVSQNSTMWMLQ